MLADFLIIFLYTFECIDIKCQRSFNSKVLVVLESMDMNFRNYYACQDYCTKARGSEKYVTVSTAQTYKIQEEMSAGFQVLSFA